MQKIIRGPLAICVLATLGLQGCAYTNSSPNVYNASQTQREESVRFGTIESVRTVRISANNGQASGVGAIGGGAVGAVGGSTVGNGTGSLLTGIVGGIAGAVAGNAIENAVAIKDGLEITVRLDDGDLRAITQDSTGEAFQTGDRVRLLSDSGVTRVTH